MQVITEEDSKLLPRKKGPVHIHVHLITHDFQQQRSGAPSSIQKCRLIRSVASETLRTEIRLAFHKELDNFLIPL